MLMQNELAAQLKISICINVRLSSLLFKEIKKVVEYYNNKRIHNSLSENQLKVNC